jgi:hypothetical protein
MGKLGFDVDFYGSGFPPGAYHSKGYQDGIINCSAKPTIEDLSTEPNFPLIIVYGTSQSSLHMIFLPASIYA